MEQLTTAFDLYTAPRREVDVRPRLRDVAVQVEFESKL